MIEQAVLTGKDRLLQMSTAAVVTTLLTLVCLGLTALRGYDFVTRQSPVLLRLTELQDRILLYDETLTMSAQMAAATGDPRWEARYRRAEPQLDATLAEIMQLAPTGAQSQATARTHDANIRLVVMENRAFELVRLGQRAAALEQLGSEAYETNKNIYVAGMAEFTRSLRSAAADQAELSRMQLLWGIVLTALSVPLLLLTWLRVLRSLRRRQAELGLNNLRLDATVARRTRELADALNDAQAAYLGLTESEEKYRHILNTIQDGYFEIDLRGNFTLCNPAMAELTGYPLETLKGMAYARYTDKAEGEKLFRAVNAVFKTGISLKAFEFTIIRGDGEHRHVENSFSLILDRDQHAVGFRGIVRDVSERRQAQDALQASETRYGALVNSTSDLIWSTGAGGKIAGSHPHWQDFTGLSAEEMQADGWARAHHPDDLPAVMAKWGRCLETGTAIDYEARVRRHDGSYRIMKIHGTPVLAEDGRLREWIGIASDVTDLRQSEKATGELASIVASSQDAIYSETLEGIVVSWNTAAERMYGYPAEEIIGRPLSVIYPADRPAECGMLLERLKNGELLQHLKTERMHRDGHLISVSLSVSPLLGRTGQVEGASIIARDISAERRVQEALQQAKSAAENANRAKSEFIANISHEVRTPMNGVVGMTELLLGTAVTAEQREYLELLRGSADAMLGVINLILDFSKLEAGRWELQPRPFSLRGCVADTLKSLALSASQKGLALRCQVAPELADSLNGDPGSLRQVIVNLVGNAIKFTERGEVAVAVTAEPARENRQRFTITVRDTGIGIPAKKLAMIFDPFAQADGSSTRNHGGTGLGLSICRHLAHLMEGTLGVESVAGQGSAFHFTAALELAAAEDRGAAAAPVAPTPDREAPLRILLAEDNPVGMLYARRLLESRGHKVTPAVNGRQALEIYGASPFDVILMDVQMPDMGGYEVVAAIRALEAGTGRHTPIIALTANAMPGDAQRSRDAGMDDHVSKPLRLETLLAAFLRNVPGGQSAASPPPGRRAELLARTGDDPALLAELAGLFEQEAGRQLSQLAEAVDRDDAEAIRFSAHSLKGSVANFSHRGAMKAADRLESLARGGGRPGIDAARRSLEFEVNALRQELSAIRKECLS